MTVPFEDVHQADKRDLCIKRDDHMANREITAVFLILFQSPHSKMKVFNSTVYQFIFTGGQRRWLCLTTFAGVSIAILVAKTMDTVLFQPLLECIVS